MNLGVFLNLILDVYMSSHPKNYYWHVSYMTQVLQFFVNCKILALCFCLHKDC